MKNNSELSQPKSNGGKQNEKQRTKKTNSEIKGNFITWTKSLYLMYLTGKCFVV